MFWLASYPKSGNTWMRVFLTNLIRQEDQPAHFNRLLYAFRLNDHKLIEHYTPFEPSELTFTELQKIRIKLLAVLHQELEELSCLKIHQANMVLESKKPFLVGLQEAVIYIVRNPLDVCVSFAHHQGWDIDRTIAFMNNDQAVLGSITRLNHRLSPEYLSSWSQNYLSWKNTVPQMLLIRYEDMLENGLKTFSTVINYLQLDYSEKEMITAIAKSEISQMQKQEVDSRFKEGSIPNRNFFRRGRSEEWRSVLSSNQINRIVSKHGEVMKELDYL